MNGSIKTWINNDVSFHKPAWQLPFDHIATFDPDASVWDKNLFRLN